MKNYRVYMSNGVSIDIKADDWELDDGGGYIFLKDVVGDSYGDIIARFENPMCVIALDSQLGGLYENIFGDSGS